MSPSSGMPTETTVPRDPQTILVIDDEQLILDLLGHWLHTAGFHVVSAHNGEEGLALFRGQSFNLVLTDLSMPVIDGFQVLATITAEAPEVPVIIISGQGDLDDSIKALRLGAWDYITKPMDFPLLVHQIGKALERAGLLKENARYRQHLQDEVEKRTAQLNQRTQELEVANLVLKREMQARQAIENELRHANERWQTTFDSMSDFVSIHDLDFTIRQANKALADFLGQRPEDLVGKRCCQVFHSQCEPWSNCPHREMLVSGLPHTAEVDDPHLGIPLLVTVSPLRFNGELIGSIHVAKDISRQKKLEEERQKRANLESIAVLCGGLAHDFNNLLTALGGYIDLAMMDGQSERLPHWLNHAKLVTNMAGELTKQLLTFSKGGTPIFRLVSAPVLLQECMSQLGKTLPRVRIEMHIADNVWPISGDYDQLRIVLRNIFYNAAEAMPDGGTLTVECRNIAKGESKECPLLHDSVLMSFTDQGVGISPDILGKIFDPYFTTSAKGATKGKGLGLALCHSIISKHHGQIAVTSKPHEGTTVTIHLLARQAASS